MGNQPTTPTSSGINASSPCRSSIRQRIRPASQYGCVAPIYNPPVPYKGSLPMAPENGSSVHINGVIPSWSKGYKICLEVDEGDVALCFNAQFDPNSNQISCNSFENGIWGEPEICQSSPFLLGNSFNLVIKVCQNDYKISVDGKSICDFKHRLAKENICFLTADGDVQLNQIRYQGNHMFQNPAMLVNFHVSGGMTCGKMIRICGLPGYSSSRFSVNVVRGNLQSSSSDIGLHCDVRFNYQGSHNVVVRKSRQNGSWGHEERHASCFPFTAGQPFEMIIRVEEEKFLIAVNNQHMYEYLHRLLPLQLLDHLYIEGDITIDGVQIQSPLEPYKSNALQPSSPLSRLYPPCPDAVN